MNCVSILNYDKFDPALDKAVLFAVGNTLVCDNLDEAKRLSWTGERFKGIAFFALPSILGLFQFYMLYFRVLWGLIICIFSVVSIDGTLLTKAGTMTGGTTGGMEARSNKWEDKKIEGLCSMLRFISVFSC